MADFPSIPWFEQLMERVNQDREFREAARWFTGKVGWQVDEQAFGLIIAGSEVRKVAEGADQAPFTMAGSGAAWGELMDKGTINRLFRQGKIQILGNKVEAMRYWKILWYLTENARPGQGG